MASYNIYQHPRTKEYIALKGDYLIGRFLPGFWQLGKGMYKKSALGFLGLFLSIPGFSLFMKTMREKGASFSFDATTIIIIVISLVGIAIIASVGDSSALDYKRQILKKGYIQKSSASLIAETEEEAIEKFIRNN